MPPENLLALADAAWRGEVSTDEVHPLAGSGTLAEVADRTAFLWGFGNVSAFETGEGLVLVDTGNFGAPAFARERVRSWSRAPLHTAVFSHGHVDHVFGVGPFEEESRSNGWPEPRVVAHENVPPRFDRYVLTAGYNAVINARQFGAPELAWPTDYRYPDVLYRDALALDVGGVRFELHHARGETDDHTWVWLPERRVLCCGDLFIWASPNAGNPQKVQRYPREWAAALRAMAELGAEVLLPGHGWPVLGLDRVREALADTAALLESIHDQVVELMNAGARLDEIVHGVRLPEELLEKPWLRPVYDEPEFVVRNVWRLYGGWYDGNPARLKPARDEEVARELAGLCGGVGALAERAADLARAGKLRLASHLAEMAWLAKRDDARVAATRTGVYSARAATERSLMARGIFSAAARESER